MNSGGLYDIFRSEVVDQAKPYLWSDEEVYRYANASYRMFVRLTGGIADITSEACEIALSVGEDQVDLHPSILRINDAWLDSDSSTVRVINFTDLGKLIQDPDYKYLKPLLRKNTDGPVRNLLIGQQRHKAQVIQIPVAVDTVKLSIYRLPLKTIVDGSHALDEIDDDHHEYLVNWMKSLAYLKQDVETFDKSKSEEFEGKFRAYCDQVKAEWARYKHKTRVVAYCGL